MDDSRIGRVVAVVDRVFHEVFDIEVCLFAGYHEVKLVVVEHLQPAPLEDSDQPLPELSALLLQLLIHFEFSVGHQELQLVLATLILSVLRNRYMAAVFFELDNFSVLKERECEGILRDVVGRVFQRY